MRINNNVRIGISMKPALHKHAKLTAAITGYSLSAVIQHMLRLFVQDPTIMDHEAPEPTGDVELKDLHAIIDRVLQDKAS